MARSRKLSGPPRWRTGTCKGIKSRQDHFGQNRLSRWPSSAPSCQGIWDPISRAGWRLRTRVLGLSPMSGKAVRRCSSHLHQLVGGSHLSRRRRLSWQVAGRRCCPSLRQLLDALVQRRQLGLGLQLQLQQLGLSRLPLVLRGKTWLMTGCSKRRQRGLPIPRQGSRAQHPGKEKGCFSYGQMEAALAIRPQEGRASHELNCQGGTLAPFPPPTGDVRERSPRSPFLLSVCGMLAWVNLSEGEVGKEGALD